MKRPRVLFGNFGGPPPPKPPAPPDYRGLMSSSLTTAIITYFLAVPLAAVLFSPQVVIVGAVLGVLYLLRKR